jgi:hypothetical protein
MDNDVAEVEQDPLCFVSAFAPEWSHFEVVAKTFFNCLGESLDMRARSPCGDYENVRENKLPFDIQKRDV